MVAAGLPAAMLGDRLATAVPMRAVRLTGALLFLVAGFVVAVGALQLI
jgi:putative Ca2+/H+ antiporter (TMEM165/GDT1 family)